MAPTADTICLLGLPMRSLPRRNTVFCNVSAWLLRGLFQTFSSPSSIASRSILLR